MKYIAGDIGGTKTLLRLLQASGSSRKILREERLPSRQFATFDDLLRKFLVPEDGAIAGACFAVAGPVFESRAHVTNVGWDIDAEALALAFGIQRVLLINDFFGVAAAVPHLPPEDLLVLNKGDGGEATTIAILGAGTGLGEAFLTKGAAGAWTVVPSEGGHKDFAPRNELQRALLDWLEKRYGHVSYERVLSGSGIVNIFTFLRELRGDAGVAALMDPALDPAAQVAALATAGNALAREAVDTFVDVYGAEAGNLALTMLPRGGVYVAGGIAVRNIGWFDDGRFLKAYLDKGRFAELLKSFPLAVIRNPEVGLIGAAELAIATT
jgi:glucokinase